MFELATVLESDDIYVTGNIQIWAVGVLNMVLFYYLNQF